ncbi:MAG: glycosyltransferase family A protein [Candidatus Thorarchaeota archaeon]
MAKATPILSILNRVSLESSNELHQELIKVGSSPTKFPYHHNCEFCKNNCESPGIPDAEYVHVTNVWNGRQHIEYAFVKLAHQTKLPRIWLWIDDGSVDGTSEEILRVSKEYPQFEVWLEKMPTKNKGNLNTIGRAYSAIMPRVIDKLDALGIKYFTIQDVDTEPCPNYFARIIWFMDNDSQLGACSGTAIGEEKVREAGMPMGGLKVVRWSIVREITKYWDLSPDTFLNIRTLKKGFKLKIWRIPVKQDTPSTSTTEKGLFYQGQLNYFIGRPFLGVLLRALRRVILRRYGSAMLRGYLFERARGTWRCDDPDVTSFYGHGKPWPWVIINLIKTKGRYVN